MNGRNVSKSETFSSDLTRSIPTSLAPVLAELELEGTEVVTLADLTDQVARAGIGTDPRLVANRLRRSGWLLSTATTGVWEFAPASHAGPLGHGDPYLELRAALAKRPGLDAAICLLSALRAHGLTDRMPERLEVAVPDRSTIPAGLRRSTRVVVFDAHLPHERLRQVPVHAVATVLVHLATRPGDVRGWGEVADALPDLVASVTAADVDAELAGRPRAVRTRLAYLVQGVAPNLASHVAPAQPTHGPAPKVWFGPRGRLKRHNAQFSVADTVLPFDPATLKPSAPAL
jgi:predicted transcriptional regulator of viral defense system